MKTSLLLSLLPLMGVALATPEIRAADSGRLRVLAEAEAPKAQIERRHIIRHGDDEKSERETVAFLGVETTPAGPELTAQLGLKKNTGLVVRHISPDSPAAAVLQEHDLLLRLDDQWLIETRQFAVLVRNHKAGDEVTLTYVRGGKESSVKIKLAEHEVPKLTHFNFPGEGEPRFDFFFRRSRRLPHESNHVLSLLDQDAPRPEAGHEAPPPPPPAHGFRSVAVNPGNSTRVFSDEHGVIELTVKDGRKSLVAKNAKGEPVFSGAIDTPAQRDAVPGDVKERLEQIESMKEFSFEPGADFEEDVEVAPLAPRKIVFPHPSSAEHGGVAF